MVASFCTSCAGTRALDGCVTSAIRSLIGSLLAAFVAPESPEKRKFAFEFALS